MALPENRQPQQLAKDADPQDRINRIRTGVADAVQRDGVIPTIQRTRNEYFSHAWDMYNPYIPNREVIQDSFVAAQEAIVHGLAGTIEERRHAVEGIFEIIEGQRQIHEEYRTRP